MTRPRSRSPASCPRGGFAEFLEAAAARRDDEAGRRGKRDAAAADIQDGSAEVGSQRIGVDVHFAGRGTFVKRAELPKRQTLNMKADLSQLQSMVAQLEVSVLVEETQAEKTDENGVAYRYMKRIHSLDGKPFCHVDLRVDNALHEKAPERYSSEIVIRVLKDMGTRIGSTRQRVTISYADFEIAQALEIKVNSPVFRVFREFFDRGGRLIYSANLIYPGDVLEFEMEFTVDSAD